MKEEILFQLKNTNKDYISGSQLAEALGVSRTAVWKTIKKLKDEGYQIESVSSKGYHLIDSPDVLSKEELQIELKRYNLINEIYHFESIGSTNTFAKELMSTPREGGILIVADEQVSGRGRLGRSWVSKKGDGLSISLVLKPTIEPSKASLITQITAAAITKAIEEITELSVGIKWPNDIIINGKKVCGILTEMSAELNQINYVVVGMGVNVNENDFPKEIREKASSLKLELGETVSRKKIIISFVKYFNELYEEFNVNHSINKTLEVCRSKSLVIGKKVRVIHGNKQREVYVKDIDDSGQLIVVNEKGHDEIVFHGEVSVRGLNGYI